MKTVSARTANQDFSRLLAEVAGGEEIVITYRGKPVAKLGPIGDLNEDAARSAAIRRMVRRMRRGARLGGIRVPREDIYNR